MQVRRDLEISQTKIRARCAGQHTSTRVGPATQRRAAILASSLRLRWDANVILWSNILHYINTITKLKLRADLNRTIL